MRVKPISLPVYTAGNAAVYRLAEGFYEVFEFVGTHEQKRATYHFKSAPGLALDRAKAKADQIAAKSA